MDLTLDESYDAFLLGMEDFDAAFLFMVQHKLQYIVSSLYSAHLRENEPARSISIDLSKKANEAVVITKELVLQGEFEMMMAGTVSMVPQGKAGQDHNLLCTVLGVPFYINGPKDVFASDCVIPAWSTKIVNRNDMAFFCVEKRQEPVIMYFSGGDTGIHVQLKKDISDKFTSVLTVHEAFASRSKTGQDEIVKRFELDGADTDTSDRAPWHVKRQGSLCGLKFDLSLLAMFWNVLLLYNHYKSCEQNHAPVSVQFSQACSV